MIYNLRATLLYISSSLIRTMLDLLSLCVIEYMQKFIGKKDEKKIQSPPITQFSGYYEFLSIEFPAWVYYQGFMYPSVAMAFQAARTNDMSLRRKISEAKEQQQLREFMQQIVNAQNWNDKRLKVMTRLNRDKFKRNKDLGLKLFATQSRLLVNCYSKGGDAEAFWGIIPHNGELEGLNTLGKILTEIRQDMKNGTDSRKWVQEQQIQNDAALWPQANLIVQKEGDQVDNLLLTGKNVFLLGNSQQNDFKLEHGSISKAHAAIYFSSHMEIILVDLNSTHGTVIIRGQTQIKLQSLRPQSLQNKDVIRFGMSTRKYTIFFSYEQVQRQIELKQQQARLELEKIQKLKALEKETAISEQKQRQTIKSLLNLKVYSCLYIENINRNFSYKDIKETFNQYGPVKNVRINIDQKTGRFMGSVLLYFDDSININTVLDRIAKKPLAFDFRIVAVTTEEANHIIQNFTNKQKQEQQRKKLQEEKVRREISRKKKQDYRKSRSRSRDHRRSSSSSSSSSSGSSQQSRPKDVRS